MPASADRLAKIRQGYAKYHEDNPFVVQPGEAETIEFKQPEAMKPRVPNSQPPPGARFARICCYCGWILTDPRSLKFGTGPKCRGSANGWPT